nr:MAG TPA: hypothetical protein [Caudoviricetes sp.]
MSNPGRTSRGSRTGSCVRKRERSPILRKRPLQEELNHGRGKYTGN